MLQGVSKIRNHVIARVFRELDLIEQWGSGVRRMFKEAEAPGLPQPEIIEVGMRVRFIVYLTEAIAVETTDSVACEVELRPELRPELPTQLPTQSDEPIQRLLLVLTDEEKSSGALRSVPGIKHRPNFRDNYLHSALDAELIEMTIPEKPAAASRNTATTKGKDFLATEHQGCVE